MKMRITTTCLRINYLVFSLIFFIFIEAFAQDVTVNLNMKHSVNGVSELERSKFFIMHHSVDDSDWDGATQRDTLLKNNDIYLGRNTGGIKWHFKQTSEDPQKPGWPSIANMESRGTKERNEYGDNTVLHKFEHRTAPMVVGGQPLSMYPNGQETPAGLVYENYEAVAEFYANYFREFYGDGGSTGEQKPKYVEVFNEPFVKASKLNTTTANISECHNIVAKRVKELNPDMKVGGYSAAYPEYEKRDFGQWNNTWKTFIDIAGANMDFFSYHLYDGQDAETTPQKRRKGSNIEAIMDMVEHYTVLKHGQRKPVYVTEFGYTIKADVYYSKKRDWYRLRSYNSILMQLLERQDVLIGAIPFMIMKAEWGRSSDGIPYSPRIMRQKKEVAGYEGDGDDWVYTDLIKYYQFWKELKGVRAESRSNNEDILTDVYVDGNKAYVLINNMSTSDHKLKLAVHETEGLGLSKVSVSHLHANDKDEAVWDKFDLVDQTEVEISAEATLILTYEYDGDIVQNESSEETKYFADQYLKPIQANSAINVNIKGVKKAQIGEAVLRIGIGRSHGLSLHPTVNVNGVNIPVPTNWRGDDQSARAQFFGILEVPVPYTLIQENNQISITFNDNGGHVSSISMQHYTQTADPQRPEETLSINDDEMENNLVLFPNPTKNSVKVNFPSGINEAQLKVFDMLGVPQFERQLFCTNQAINVETLNGIYIFQLHSDDRIWQSKLLVK